MGMVSSSVRFVPFSLLLLTGLSRDYYYYLLWLLWLLLLLLLLWLLLQWLWLRLLLWRLAAHFGTLSPPSLGGRRTRGPRLGSLLLATDTDTDTDTATAVATNVTIAIAIAIDTTVATNVALQSLSHLVLPPEQLEVPNDAPTGLPSSKGVLHDLVRNTRAVAQSLQQWQRQGSLAVVDDDAAAASAAGTGCGPDHPREAGLDRRRHHRQGSNVRARDPAGGNRCGCDPAFRGHLELFCVVLCCVVLCCVVLLWYDRLPCLALPCLGSCYFRLCSTRHDTTRPKKAVSIIWCCFCLRISLYTTVLGFEIT